MITELAHLIMVPYLVLFGYEMDASSVSECHESIEIQREELKNESFFFRLCSVVE